MENQGDLVRSARGAGFSRWVRLLLLLSVFLFLFFSFSNGFVSVCFWSFVMVDMDPFVFFLFSFFHLFSCIGMKMGLSGNLFSSCLMG